MINFIVLYRTGLTSQEFVRPASVEASGQYGTRFGNTAPFEGKSIDSVMSKFIKMILPGVVHWQHPRFFAYFPAGGSYASLLGNMLLGCLSTMGFEWATSPINTELELSVTRWLGNAMGLPQKFMGSISALNSISFMLPTSCEAILLVMLAARQERVKQGCPISTLVVYSSKLAHVSIKKAALILGIQHREVTPVELRGSEFDSLPSHHKLNINSPFKYGIRKHDVESEVERDIANGLVPFFLACTLGTTELCSFDQLQGMEMFASKHSMWLHVDASYAGSAFICPELRMNLLNGIEHFHSVTVNPYKWLLMGHNGCCVWTTRRHSLECALELGAQDMYLLNSTCLNKDGALSLEQHLWGIDLRKVSLATSRSFLSLKLWMICELYGLSKLQSHIRKHVRLANQFAKLVKSERRLKLIQKPRMGVVCFRLAPPFTANHTNLLLQRLNESGRLFLTGSWISDKLCIVRMCVCSEYASENDINYLWRAICYELNRMDCNDLSS